MEWQCNTSYIGILSLWSDRASCNKEHIITIYYAITKYRALIARSWPWRLSSVNNGKATVSHFPPASFCRTACFRSLFDHMTKIFIIAISLLSMQCWLLKLAIVNVSVACLSTKRTLFPWNIVSASELEHSFRDFFYESIQPCIPSMSELSYDLVHAAVGANKEKMDKVDLDLPVIPVVESFVL